MEKKKKSHLWHLLLLLLPFGFILAENCTVLPENLSCYNDYNATINCVWNSTYEHQDDVCTIAAERSHIKNKYYNSCQLQSEDLSRPMQKKCTLLFKKYRFVQKDKWFISINCSEKQVLRVLYKPYCHIKLNRPPKPELNFTTIVWLPQVTAHRRFSKYQGQLQLRQQDQPWMDTSLFKDCRSENLDPCTIQLPKDLIKGEKYEARIRVQQTEYSSTWSNWSPSESWVATVGRERPPTPPQHSEVVMASFGTLVCLVLLVLIIILGRTDRTTWIYIVKRLRGPPLPHPGKSFLQDVDFKNPKNSSFSSDCFHSLIKPVEIVQVEVNSSPSAVMSRELVEKLFKDVHPSDSSSFFNPIYSHLSPPLPPVLPLNAGKLEGDMTYRPVGCHSDDKNVEHNEEEAILRLLSNGNCKATFVISDYEKVEREEMERIRLQSLDSGVCSAEEVSQESLESDSIIKTGEEDTDEIEVEEDFLKLVGCGGVLDKGSIQVCSGYEQIQKMPEDNSELLSMDSGISSGCGPLMTHEDSLTEDDDESKSDERVLLLCSPHTPVLQCSLSALPSLPLNLPAGDLGGSGERLL